MGKSQWKILITKKLAVETLLYLIIDKADECIEEKYGNKFLTLVFTDKRKEVLIKYTELWDKIKIWLQK